MPPSMFGLSAKPHLVGISLLRSGREIALLRVQGYIMQEVARRLRAGGIDNLPRAGGGNAATRSGGLESIVRRQRNGTPSALLAAQSGRS